MLVARITRNLLEEGMIFAHVLQNDQEAALFADLADIIRHVLFISREEDRKERAKRRNEGVAAAKERGVRFGRRSKPLPKNFDNALELWKKGELNISEAARVCGMSRSTFRYQAHCRIADGNG